MPSSSDRTPSSRPAPSPQAPVGRARHRDVGAILLARGYGRIADPQQRLFRHPLVPVALTPLLQFPLRWLARSGLVGKVAISARDVATSVSEWLASQPSMPFELAVASDTYPRGPAGMTRDAAALIPSSRYVVSEGARLPDLDLQALLDAHVASGAAITTVIETDRRSRHGAPRQLPGGVYIFEREVLDLIAPNGFQDIKQGLLETAHARRLGVHAWERRGLTPAIVDFASYLGTSNWLVSNLDARPEDYPGFVACGEGLRHPSAEVHPSATLLGPVLVGEGARIEAGAVVVGPSVIGDRAVLAPNATVSRSVLLDAVLVESDAHVDWSVVTAGARVQTGESIADRVVVTRSRGLRAGLRRSAPVIAPAAIGVAARAACLG
ncbi:MAG: NDP-sugar synthase [Gemmatimonadaceae bacterium]|nr:NDP-sugar synthase [Gemmatimonadaceae bacterium]